MNNTAKTRKKKYLLKSKENLELSVDMVYELMDEINKLNIYYEAFSNLAKRNQTKNSRELSDLIDKMDHETTQFALWDYMLEINDYLKHIRQSKDRIEKIYSKLYFESNNILSHGHTVH